MPMLQSVGRSEGTVDRWCAQCPTVVEMVQFPGEFIGTTWRVMLGQLLRLAAWRQRRQRRQQQRRQMQSLQRAQRCVRDAERATAAVAVAAAAVRYQESSGHLETCALMSGGRLRQVDELASGRTGGRARRREGRRTFH